MSYSKIIRIKSSDKSRGTNNDFEVKYNNLLDLHNIKAVSIKSVTFPNVFYNVKNNWVFSYTDSVAGAQTVSINAGQYSLSELINILQTGINADITPRTVTITAEPNYTQRTKKLSFTVSTGSITITADENTKKYLGITSDLLASPAGYAQEFADLGGEKIAYVYSQKLSRHKYIDEKGHQSIIAECPIVVPFGFLNVYESNSSDLIDTVEYESLTNLNDIDISLRDREGNLLELGNNHELSITLKIFY
jgi:hypothetical protein